MMRARCLAAIALLVACRDATGPGAGSVTHDVVFEARNGNSSLLAIVDLTTRNIRQVSPLGVFARDPSPSPDGARIAFVGQAASGTYDIFVMNRDGSGIVQLTDDPARDDQPAWSPNGTTILFRSFRAGALGDIWAMDADGGNQRNLTPDPAGLVIGEREPAWSPDGTKIAYSSGSAACRISEPELEVNWSGAFNCNVWRLWVMASDGSDQHRVTTGQAGYQGMPAWSPDGQRLWFSTASLGGNDIATTWAEGGAPEVLRIAGGQGMPVVEPGGGYLVVVEQYNTTSNGAMQLLWPRSEQLELLVEGSVPNSVLNPAFIRRQ